MFLVHMCTFGSCNLDIVYFKSRILQKSLELNLPMNQLYIRNIDKSYTNTNITKNKPLNQYPICRVMHWPVHP